ncbi:DNA-binding IclR family transcriptional regulator [Halarchaeum solikamskense]|nr:DNA-binding IclR family transcriptional regulator [Halarchaeum solikamskense]
MVEQNQEDRTDSEQVLKVLRDEYRANPLLIRQRTDLSKQRVYRVLNRLCTSGDAEKVCKGLYQIGDTDDAGRP